MKNALKVLVVALTTLAFSGVSFAQEKKATPATPAAPATEKKSEMKSEKPKTTRITGEVTSVDAKAATLTVKAKDKETNLTADTKAKGALEKVKVGDKVEGRWTCRNAKNALMGLLSCDRTMGRTGLRCCLKPGLVQIANVGSRSEWTKARSLTEIELSPNTDQTYTTSYSLLNAAILII